MRDKLKAMRGFTSAYNVLWARHHINYVDLMNNRDKEKEKQQQIRDVLPERIRKYYDKIMRLIERFAKR